MVKMPPKTVSRLKKQIKSGSPDEQSAQADQLFDKWFAGVSQNIKGAVRADFIDKFLSKFNADERTQWEDAVENLQSIKDPTRFRKEAMMHLALMFQLGGVSVDHGEDVMDIEEMVEESDAKIRALDKQ